MARESQLTVETLAHALTSPADQSRAPGAHGRGARAPSPSPTPPKRLADVVETNGRLASKAADRAAQRSMNRRPVPFDLGPVHFIGIGGIGMSGIAEIMLRIGYTVQGTDAKASANTERLEKLGAKIFIGQDPANVEGASAIVYSTAVKADNPEMVGRPRASACRWCAAPRCWPS